MHEQRDLQPDREADVDDEQTPGQGETGSDVSSDQREVGVRAAVERGPAELSSEGEPVRDVPHASLEDREPARSTDDL